MALACWIHPTQSCQEIAILKGAWIEVAGKKKKKKEKTQRMTTYQERPHKVSDRTYWRDLNIRWIPTAMISKEGGHFWFTQRIFTTSVLPVQAAGLMKLVHISANKIVPSRNKYIALQRKQFQHQ